MKREILPARRASETFEFEAGVPGYSTARFVATVGFYDDGRVGEAFLHPTKTGSDRDISVQESAILLSFLLQRGEKIENVRSAMPRTTDGQPEGPMGALLDRLATDAERDRQANAQAKEAKRAASAAVPLMFPAPGKEFEAPLKPEPVP